MTHGGGGEGGGGGVSKILTGLPWEPCRTPPPLPRLGGSDGGGPPPSPGSLMKELCAEKGWEGEEKQKQNHPEVCLSSH